MNSDEPQMIDKDTALDNTLILSLLDDIPGPVLVMKDERICGYNSAVARLFKVPDKRQLLEKDFFYLSAPKQPDGSDSLVTFKKIRGQITPGQVFNFEWVFRRSDESTIDAKVIARQVVPERGSYILFSIIDNRTEARVIRDILSLVTSAREGNLTARLKTDGYHGDIETMIQSINSMLDDVINPFNDMNRILVQISNGDIHARVEKIYQGEHEQNRKAVNTLADTIQLLQNEIGRLITAAKDGKLGERGRPELFTGAYADTITGLNEMLDLILAPIREGNAVLQKMSRGDLSRRVSIECVGDHARLKNAINQVHDWLSDLIIYVTRISEGDLSASIQKASDADQMYGPLMKMRDNLKSVIEDITILTERSARGELNARADLSGHSGEFRSILEGINKTLDSVLVPVKEAMKTSERYASYDFSRQSEKGRIAEGDWKEFERALEKVGLNVSEAVRLITEEVKILDTVSASAHGSITDVSAGASSLADIAQAVSLNSERGSESITQVLRAMEDLAVNVSSVSARTEEVNKLASGTNTISKKGTELAHDAETGMDEITQSTEQVVSLVHEIMEEMKTISKITHVISDIANQTNLLALNAAIEAARAGEAGRGFAVVASEVKSLALESRESAGNISEMIELLQKKTEIASETMDKSAESVHSGGKALKETLDVFNEIIGSVSTINTRMDEVARSAEQQAAAVQEVTASIHEVSNLVLDTSKQAVGAAAASQQASAAIDQISDQTQEVFNVSQRLSNAMKKFTI